LRSHLEQADFSPQLTRQETQGYRLAFAEGGGQVVAVAGFLINEAFDYGKYLYVYDLVTGETARSGGQGGALLGFLKTFARGASSFISTRARCISGRTDATGTRSSSSRLQLEL
jgi:hypothetical protein